ncbi:acetyltransferase [Lonepinella sp. BR2919]|uniref:acetyltransferase n=1 Tax=unclassified Lonepinella TaxID=2642006 RepID=UPI003F6DBE61
MKKKKIVFIGAGGYAKSVLDSLNKDEFEFCGFIDRFKPVGDQHLGYPILAQDIEYFENIEQYCYFICIGNNEYRLDKFLCLRKLGCEIVNIVDKSAIIASKVKLGIGVFVGKMAIINSDVVIGNNVIVNTKALIEHGCSVGNHSNISTNATLNGDVRIDDYCFIGSSSVITGQIRVGENAIVGAGAVVINNVESHTVVAGIPAKFIKDNIKKG